mmetsp:Transcript_151967/g.487812  ORF Transcript_151967/g.487812 Transcript_151967/m.487812 type:complete len:703 (+) Transcript_151967:3001-5109(+)
MSIPPGTRAPPPECNRHSAESAQMAPRASPLLLSSPVWSLATVPSTEQRRPSSSRAGSRKCRDRAVKVIGHTTPELSSRKPSATFSVKPCKDSKLGTKSLPHPVCKWWPTLSINSHALASERSPSDSPPTFMVLMPWNCDAKKRQTEIHSLLASDDSSVEPKQELNNPSKIDLCKPWFAIFVTAAAALHKFNAQPQAKPLSSTSEAATGAAASACHFGFRRVRVDGENMNFNPAGAPPMPSSENTVPSASSKCPRRAMRQRSRAWACEATADGPTSSRARPRTSTSVLLGPSAPPPTTHSNKVTSATAWTREPLATGAPSSLQPWAAASPNLRSCARATAAISATVLGNSELVKSAAFDSLQRCRTVSSTKNTWCTRVVLHSSDLTVFRTIAMSSGLQVSATKTSLVRAPPWQPCARRMSSPASNCDSAAGSRRRCVAPPDATARSTCSNTKSGASWSEGLKPPQEPIASANGLILDRNREASGSHAKPFEVRWTRNCVKCELMGSNQGASSKPASNEWICCTKQSTLDSTDAHAPSAAASFTSARRKSSLRRPAAARPRRMAFNVSASQVASARAADSPEVHATARGCATESTMCGNVPRGTVPAWNWELSAQALSALPASAGKNSDSERARAHRSRSLKRAAPSTRRDEPAPPDEARAQSTTAQASRSEHEGSAEVPRERTPSDVRSSAAAFGIAAATRG